MINDYFAFASVLNNPVNPLKSVFEWQEAKKYLTQKKDESLKSMESAQSNPNHDE